MSFEFIPLGVDQTEAFPAAETIKPGADTPRHRIESVSLPLATRRLGRTDEPWLMQIATRLRVIEAHFSLFSGRKVIQVDLLQFNLKHKRTEIDAIYLLTELDENGGQRELIVTCEAKHVKDDILSEQIVNQARLAFNLKNVNQDIVVPVAIKCIPDHEIFVVEFSEFERSTAESTELVFASSSLHKIVPPVPGICLGPTKKRRKRTKAD